jgi:hypothetical protein
LTDLDDERRNRRERELAELSDEELRAEVLVHARSRWPPAPLLEHAKKHSRDWQSVYGSPLTPSQIETLSDEVLGDWTRLFTGLVRGGVTYVFAREGPRGAMLLVVTRNGTIRSVLPSHTLERWIRRNEHYIEVTDRAHRAFRGG